VKAVAVVLAAGASSRFGSPKLLADLDGRPILQHVLDAIEAAGVDDVVVVLGDGHEAVEHVLAPRRQRLVVNPRPQDGLSSSLRVGLDAAGADPAADAAIVLLGDQPDVRPDAIRAVLQAAETSDRSFVQARYAADGAPNPVLVRREAWPEASVLDGDRGLGPLLAAHPQRVLAVDVEGANPDVDTPADLERLAAGRSRPAEVRA
jgi:molybdenum cofactor cytidylyltransferase